MIEYIQTDLSCEKSLFVEQSKQVEGTQTASLTNISFSFFSLSGGLADKDFNAKVITKMAGDKFLFIFLLMFFHLVICFEGVSLGDRKVPR